MLKNENIIGRLSESAKIDLLTNFGGMTDRELITMGVPGVKVGVLTEMMKTIYPSPALLANSWDKQLVQRVAEASGLYMASRGVGLAITPVAKVKINPYRTAVSEDVYLSSQLAGAYAEGVRSAGITPCISGLSVEADEVAWMDKNPDSRVIYEYIVKPYVEATKNGGINVAVREDLHSASYGKENHSLAATVSTDTYIKGAYAVCEHVSAENTVKYINNGIICLQGAGYAVQAALRKYINVKKSVDRGEMREEEPLAEVERGGAISPEMLDGAVDRMIEFIKSCAVKYVGDQEALQRVNSLTKDAARDSVVLLKNEDNLLPVTNKKKIAIIGDVGIRCAEQMKVFSQMLENEGHVVLGLARGYEIGKDVPVPSLESEALELAKSADVVIFFAGTDEIREKYITRTRNLSLPANQDILAHKLVGECEKKTVAVLTSNYAVDISSLENFEALVLAPFDVRCGAEALAEARMGVFSPSGRLASSLYRNCDSSFKKQHGYLNSGMKAGRFIGYRYYDTAHFNIGYPFGYGLGYSSFAYSNLTVDPTGRVTLNVKNVGKRASAEIVQLYVGIEGGAESRPLKELVAFEKIFLKEGESTTVTLSFELPEIFDASSGAYVREKGKYNVYVGSSVRDIKLTGSITAGESELQKKFDPLSQYLQSESNIISENYTLEAKYPTMKKSIKNIFSGVALLLLAILLQVYCVSTNTSSAFLNLLTVAILGVGVAFFVIDAIDKKKIGEIEKAEAEKANEKWFEDATKLESFDTDRMFADEFGDDRADAEIAEQHTDEVQGFGDEYLAYIDKDFTFENAAEELERFALERGCKLDQSTVCSLLSSVASSRLLVLNGPSKEEFVKLASVICEYFECTAHIDTVDNSYTTGARMFFKTDASGNASKTGVLRVIEEAAKAEADIHVSAIAGVNKAVMENCFADIVKYAKNPYANSMVSAINDKYRFSQNICFIVGLESGATLNDIPADVASVATVMDIKVSLTAPAKNVSSVHKFKYYQLDYMSERVVNRSEVDESIWKKVDRLEEFVGKQIEYSITNKQWLSMEKYVAVYTACRGELFDAVDRAVASKLIPVIISLASNSEGGVYELGDQIESIFGENNADACRKAIRSADLSRTIKKS